MPQSNRRSAANNHALTGDHTILALSTPPGRSARAMLRLSGPAVPFLLERFFDPLPPPGASASVLRLGSSGLPVLVARFVAPRSYTGEHLAELQLPGSPALFERTSRLLLEAPEVRPAAPGEFTARAFLNGKLTLNQAEGIALAIAAEGRAELEAAQRLISGRTGDLYRTWSNELAALLALVEAGIDFTDQEDVVPIAPAVLCARLEALRREMLSRIGERRGGELGRALPVVALVGAPNAGKSTLFNALLGRRRAATSPVAGTTRDVLAEPLDFSRDVSGGGTVMLTDLAGLEPETPNALPRGADDLIRAAAQGRAREALARADLLIHCDPAARFDALPPTDAPIILVRTKADLAAPAAGAQVLPVCALDGRNLAVLRRRIAAEVCGAAGGAEAILAPRHRYSLVRTAERIADALAQIDAALPSLRTPELTAGLLREALDSLGELTGRISPDDIIGRVFATFCIGK